MSIRDEVNGLRKPGVRLLAAKCIIARPLMVVTIALSVPFILLNLLLLLTSAFLSYLGEILDVAQRWLEVRGSGAVWSGHYFHFKLMEKRRSWFEAAHERKR